MRGERLFNFPGKIKESRAAHTVEQIKLDVVMAITPAMLALNEQIYSQPEDKLMYSAATKGAIIGAVAGLVLGIATRFIPENEELEKNRTDHAVEMIGYPVVGALFGGVAGAIIPQTH